MDNTREFESCIRDLDERLERLSHQNEASRVQQEIDSLEQKLAKLYTDSMVEDKYRPYDDRPRPTAEYMTSSPSHDTKPKVLEDWPSPIRTDTREL